MKSHENSNKHSYIISHGNFVDASPISFHNIVQPAKQQLCITGSSCSGCCPLGKSHLNSSQGGLKQLKLVSDIIERKIGPLGLKCKTFVLT
jgi:hypothetical protein